MNKQIIAYYRVSTKQQGDSGLGLEAQRAAVVRAFGVPAYEFTEVESGKNDDRPKLNAAIRRAREVGGLLVVAKLDRLSRNLAFIAMMTDSDVEFKCADMPHVDNLTIRLLGVMAQHERELISKRTKEALAVLKEKGVKLGNPNAAETMKELRKRRTYWKPDEAKLAIVRKLKDGNTPLQDVLETAQTLFNRSISLSTLYRWLGKEGFNRADGLYLKKKKENKK